MTICSIPLCGAYLIGQNHHSDKRGQPLCCVHTHPGKPCPAEIAINWEHPFVSVSSVPSTPAPASGVNTNGKSSKKKKPTSATSKMTESTRTGVGQATPVERQPEPESGKALILQGKEGGKIMSPETKKRRTRRKHLLEWKPVSWEAGNWLLGEGRDGIVHLYDKPTEAASSEFATKFTSVEEAQDYAETIEAYRQRWVVK